MSSRRLLPLFLPFLFMLSACGSTFHPPAAVVHGSDITEAQLRQSVPLFRFVASLQQAPCGSTEQGETPVAACSRFVLSELIQEEVVGAYARTHDVSVSRTDAINLIIPLEQRLGGHAALLEQLSRQGLSFSDLRDLASHVLLIQRVAQAVAGQVVPTADLRRRYQDERLQFTLIHVAHILLHNHGTAVRIAREATPRNFALLARRYSRDPGSASRGGDLGVNRATGLDNAFVRAALRLSPGQISGPVHTRFGWHVIRLISLRTISFPQARTRLLSEVAGQAFTTWLRRQSRSGGIDVNPRYGRFDPATGRVVPVRCTAETLSPDCQASPAPTP